METFPRYWPFVRGIHRSPIKKNFCGSAYQLTESKKRASIIVLARGVRVNMAAIYHGDISSQSRSVEKVSREISFHYDVMTWKWLYEEILSATVDSPKTTSNAELWWCPCCQSEQTFANLLAGQICLHLFFIYLRWYVSKYTWNISRKSMTEQY